MLTVIGAQPILIRLLMSHWGVRRFYLACHLAAAINPTDLDALDESVPFTKANPAALRCFYRPMRCGVCADLDAMEERVRTTEPALATHRSIRRHCSIPLRAEIRRCR